MKYLLIFFICCVGLISEIYAQEEGGAITVKASPRVAISGYPVLFSGNTIIGKEVLPVNLKLTYPDGKVVDLKTTTDKKGDFKINYTKAYATGQYIITATSADEKDKHSDTFKVTTVTGVANTIQNDFFKSTQAIQKSFSAILEGFDQVPPQPDIDAQKAKVQDYIKKLSELKAAEEKAAKALREWLRLIGPPNPVKFDPDRPRTEPVLKAVEELNEEIAEKLPVLEAKAAEIKNKSLLCERCNMMMEVCGFASLVLDLKGKILTKLKNLASDKIVPGWLDREADTRSPDGTTAGKESFKFAFNGAQKTLYAATEGAMGISNYIGTGVSLDVCSYLGKLLYAKYCEDLKGNFVTYFKSTFNADNGNPWWIYDVNLKGEMKLRYSKKTDLSKGAEITGEFTGYRVKYGISEDFEQVETVPAGMTLLKSLRFSPLAVDANSINNDLGAIAMAGIPGSFRIQVKGIVNNKNELRLQVVESELDRETVENNRLYVILINAMLPIPIIKRFVIPIAKNKVIFRALLKDRVFLLQQAKGVITVTVKDEVTKLPLPGDVILLTILNMSLTNKESVNNSNATKKQK